MDVRLLYAISGIPSARISGGELRGVGFAAADSDNSRAPGVLCVARNPPQRLSA
jgi:hypothetical protein